MPPATSACPRWPAAEAAIYVIGVIVRLPGQAPPLELEVDGPEAVLSRDLAPGDGEWPQWGVQVLDGHGAWVQHVPFLELAVGARGTWPTSTSAGTPTRATIHRVPGPPATTSGGS